MDMVNIKINGMACEVPAGSTILKLPERPESTFLPFAS